MHWSFVAYSHQAVQPTGTVPATAGWQLRGLMSTADRTAPLLPQVFAKPAFEGVRKYFRYLLFTTEDSNSKLPRVLRFSFALPSASKVCRRC